MNFFRSIKLVSLVTKIGNLFDEIEKTRLTHLPGAGGGFDSLPISRQVYFGEKLPAWRASLETYPRHEVTRQIAKSIVVSHQMGRTQRAQAYERMLIWLVEENLALDMETFLESFGA